MKKHIILSLLVIGGIVGSAQAGGYFLKRYADQDAPLSVSNVDAANAAVTFSGTTTTDNTIYFTNYRTECDQVVCGYDVAYQCHTYQSCNSNSSSGGVVLIPNDPGHIPGQPNPPAIPIGPVSCHNGNWQSCGNVSVPRYCNVNCRQVPFRDSRVENIQSSLRVTVRSAGLDAATLKNRVSEVHVGINMTSQYANMVSQGKVASQAREFTEAYNAGVLSPSDNTVLVIKAKGLRVAQTKSWLSLNGFSAGTPVGINVDLVSTGDNNDHYSVLTTTESFPSIHTSTQNP